MKRVNFLRAGLLSLTKDQAATVAITAVSFFVLMSIWFGQILWLYVLVMALTGLIILQYPSIGLYVIMVCTMWFERHFTLREFIWNQSSYKLYPLDVVIIITGVSILLAWSRKKIQFKLNRLDVPIILFGIMATVAFAHGLMLNRDPALAFSTYKNYALYAIVYVYAVLLLNSRDEWKQMLRWFSIGGVGLFFFLFYGMYAGEGIWSEYTPLSTAGSRLIAGTHVYYMVLFSFWVLSMHLWREKEETNDDPKLLISILALIVIGLLVSLVRHLWIALVVIVPLWILFFEKRERKQLKGLFVRGVLLFTFLGFAFLWAYTLLTGETPKQIAEITYVLKQRVNITTVVNLTDSSFAWRWAAWQGALSLWETNPIVGAGFGHMVEGVFDVLPFRVPMRELHNNYLGILVQMGIIGFGIVVYWFSLLLKTIKDMWKKASHYATFEKRLLFSASSWILLFMVVFVISVYWDINLFIIFWWWALAALRFIYVEHQH